MWNYFKKEKLAEAMHRARIGELEELLDEHCAELAILRADIANKEQELAEHQSLLSERDRLTAKLEAGNLKAEQRANEMLAEMGHPTDL